MWTIEGHFRDPDAVSNSNAEVYPQERWLRPERVYSIGRDVVNDFSRLGPKNLSRYHSITLDAGPHLLDDPPNLAEKPKRYSLTLTNHSTKDLFLTRTGSSVIIIKSESHIPIEPDDKIALTDLASGAADSSNDSIGFRWHQVNICFSQLKPDKGKSTQDASKDAGFSFSISRFPSDHHTHFLPTPLTLTLPIGYALVKNIQFISHAWLELLIEAIRIDPPKKKKKTPQASKKAGEDEQVYQQRCQVITSLNQSAAKGFSNLEKDFKNWGKLVLFQENERIPEALKSWLQDPLKLNPNPARKELFADLCVILLANEKNDDYAPIEEIIRAGSGQIVVHTSPPLDESLPFRQQVKNLWPQTSHSVYRILMGTHDFISSTDCKDPAVKTVHDLLHAISDVDKFRLAESTDYHEVVKGSGHSNKTENVSVADNASISDAPAHSRSADLVVGDHSTDTEPDAPPLIRRTASRPYAERMDEFISQAEPHAKAEGDEIEVYKRLTTIDNPADDTLVSIQAEPLAQSSTQALNRIGDENPCSLDKNSESQSSSPRSSPPLLKRKARDPAGPDFDRFLPFLNEGASQAPAKPGSGKIADGLNESGSVAKRQKLDHCLSEVETTHIPRDDLRLDEVYINAIEGPASKMLRETATQREKSLKRKVSQDLFPSDGDEPSENCEKTQRTQKKARTQTRQAMERSRSDLSAGGEKATKRKTCGRSNATSPKKSRSQIKEGEEDEDSELADQYLSVKTTGKRLTEEEIQSNLEFNRLRISKPPVLLKTKPIITRPIGWDEEDQSENELREMNDWADKGTQPASSKSFFQIKYVNLVKKISPVPRQVSEHRPVGDRTGNFKKFTPKTCQTRSQMSISSQPYSRRSVEMMTVRLKQPTADEHEHPRRSREASSARTQIEMDEDDDDDDETEANTRLQFTGKSKKRSNEASSMRPEEGTQTTLGLGSKSRSTSGTVHDPPAIARSRRNRAGNSPSPSEDELSSPPAKLPPSSTRTLSRPTRTQSRSQPQKKRPVALDPDSESDGDELAFKGFTRSRA